MVSYNLILQTIGDYVEKCSVTLKGIKKNIEPLVKSLTDTQEEYELLMEELPRFYRDRYNLDHETQWLWDYHDKVYMEENGDAHSVRVPYSAVREGIDGDGILLSIHNHPNSCSFQSPADYRQQAQINTKYNISIANDGIIITKNENGYRSRYVDVERTTFKTINGIIQDFRDTPVAQKIYKDFQDGKLDEETAEEKLNKEMSDYFNKDADKYCEMVNKDLEKDGLKIVSHHIKIEK